MDKGWLLVLLSLHLLAGCRSMSAPPSFRTQNQHPELPLKVKAEQFRFSESDTVRLTLSNPTNSTFELYYSRYLKIEHWKKKRWQKIPYLPCNCAQLCDPPAAVLISPGQEITITWNQQTVRCKYLKGAAVPERIEKQAPKGYYRMIFSYRLLSSVKNHEPGLLYFEFKLKR